MRRLFILMLVALGCLPLCLRAGSFVSLDLPGSQLVALSRDGCVAAGGVLDGPSAGFRWRADSGAVLLPGAIEVGGLSASGDFVAGSVLDEMQRKVAAYWDASGAQHRIEPMPGIETIGVISQAHAVSDEPRVVGSARRPGLGSVAFEWTAGTGMRALPGLGDLASARALAISADGRRIVGSERNGERSQPLLWQDGALVAPTAGLGEVLGASHDARVLLGQAEDAASVPVFFWRDDRLAPLPMPFVDTAVRFLAGSDDGRVLVGSGGNQRAPALWLDGEGYLALDTLLARHGIALPADWYPVALTGVSGDGRRLGGWGKRAGDRLDSFLIDLGDIAPDCSRRTAVAVVAP